MWHHQIQIEIHNPTFARFPTHSNFLRVLIFSLDVTQCFVTRAQQRVSLPLPPFFLPSPLTLENHCGGPLTLVIYACFLNARLREKTKHLEPKSIKNEPDWMTSRSVAPSLVFLSLSWSTTSFVRYFFSSDLQSAAACNDDHNYRTIRSCSIGFRPCHVTMRMFFCASTLKESEHARFIPLSPLVPFAFEIGCANHCSCASDLWPRAIALSLK